MWSLEPKFFDEHGPLVDDHPELSPKDAAAWDSASTAFQTLSITACIATQSMVAATRYGQVHGLEEKYPHWMLLKALLAEVHYLLNDTFGAQQRLLLVQDALGRGKDEQLDRAVLELSKLMEEEGDEEGDEVEEGITVRSYGRPAGFSSDLPCSWSVDEIRRKWQILTSAALAEFARYAAITTNVLEGVFSVDGQSWTRLVKRGFYINSIEGISASSRIKKKEKIVAILKNTDSSFRYLKDESMIQALHKTLMEGDNLSFGKDEDEQAFAALVPCGIYRRVPCFASHPRHNVETRYCLWRQISREMQWYQWAFLTIHPFADGNGRVSRMISSIPLLKAGLPQVVVSDQRKHKYFDALLEADSSGDLVPLASFLKEEVDLAIIHISKLVE